MRSKEQFFEKQSISTERSIEEKLREAKIEKKIVEIITSHPAGEINERVKWHKFKNVEPLFFDQNDRERTDVFLTTDIRLKTLDGQVISFRKLASHSLRGFIREKYNQIIREAKDLEIKDFIVINLMPRVELLDDDIAERIGKEKIILYGDVSAPDFFISLLHEIYHTHAPQSFGRHKTNLIDKIDLAYGEVKESGRMECRPDEVLYSPEFESDKTPRPINKRLIYEFLKSELEEEKWVWTRVREKLKEYRQKNINLAPTLTDEQIEEIIARDLNDYQKLVDRYN